METDWSVDHGPYSEFGDLLTLRGAQYIGAGYGIANIRGKGRTVATNHCWGAAFRGYGSPETEFPSEVLMICVRECVFLQKFKGYPRLYARQVNNNASIVKGLHTANAVINGCALCGQCEELCPENFSMAELCLSAREDMVERGFMPPTAHEFALEDMESASGPECALTLPGVPPAAAGAQGNAPAQSTDSQWLFFPGCQLAASRVEQTAALYDLLRRRLGPEAGAGAGSGVGIMVLRPHLRLRRAALRADRGGAWRCFGGCGRAAQPCGLRRSAGRMLGKNYGTGSELRAGSYGKGMTLRRTQSLCPVCLRRIEATYEQSGTDPRDVVLRKTCPDHGTFSVPVWRQSDAGALAAPSFTAWCVRLRVNMA